jgi:hypothetical protein
MAANLKSAVTHIQILLHILLNFRINDHFTFTAAQERKIRTLVGHKRVDLRFLVLAGSQSIFAEITDYVCFSLI